MAIKSKRQRFRSKRLDLTAMREVLQDQRVWARMGVVSAAEDGEHYLIDENADVLLEVSLMPDEDLTTCRLGSLAGGPGRGVWAIPPVGTEVAVLVPDGQLDFMPIVIATLASGEVTSDLDETVIVMSNNLGDIAVIPSGDVSLGEKGATEQALRGNSFQSKFNSFVTTFNTHVHPGVTSGGSSTGTPPSPATPSDSGDLSPNVKVK